MDGEVIQYNEPREISGGTYAVGGTEEAWLNVPYNYGGIFPFRELDGKTLHASAPDIEDAIAALPGERGDDYWKPTPGNVRHALKSLLLLAEGQEGSCRWKVR